jgi:hypothetical protein
MSIADGIYQMLRGKLFNDRSKTGYEEETPQEMDLKRAPSIIDEGELISFVNNEFDRRRKERLPFENQWKLNINMIEGNQYVDINPVTHAIEEIPKMFDWQEREVFNMIAPNIETRLARLGRMRPILKVRPGSNEPDDARSTKVSEKLLTNTYYDKKMKSKMSDVNAWLESTGTCLLKHTWNNDLGALIGNVVDMQGRPVQIKEGDLEAIVCPPQEIFPDSCYHQDIDDCKDIIHAKAFHIKEIERIYGKTVQPEQVAVMQLKRAMVGTGGLGYNAMTYNYSTVTMNDYALVKEFWSRPCKDFPNGRLIVVANGVLLLYLDQNPYKIGDDGVPGLPFTKAECIKRPGVFWGKCVTERMIPLQRRYNAVRNRKAEYLNRIGIGQWTVQENSVDIEYMEENGGSAGAIIPYKRGYEKPEPVNWGSLPNEFETEVALILQEFSILTGVSEISRQGKAPAGVKSGVAIELALEQDDTRLSTTSENISDFLVESGIIWLRLYKQYAKGPRVLKSIGKNNVVELYDWSASDIKSDDVYIDPYSAMTESPTQRRQMVFDLISTGLFNDGTFSKETRAKILEAIQMGNWESADDVEELHIAKAERENMAMKQGQMTLPADFDDHIMHIYFHNKLRLTVEYEQLVAQYPIIGEMFEDHINIHMAELQQMAVQQMAQQADQQPLNAISK